MTKPHLAMPPLIASLLLVIGCASAPARSTPTATRPAAPTPTIDRDPFQVTYLQRYTLVTCPATPTPTNLCYTLIDPAGDSSLGQVSFAGTDILYQLQGDTKCGPAERTGAFTLADGDTIAIHATGTYCVPSYAVNLAFTVIGGTGAYRHAHGRGTITVGAARNAPQVAPEYWSGTIAA